MMTKTFRGVASVPGNRPRTFRPRKEFLVFLEKELASAEIVGRIVEVRISVPRPPRFRLRVVILPGRRR